jgi:hypothetical protein
MYVEEYANLHSFTSSSQIPTVQRNNNNVNGSQGGASQSEALTLKKTQSFGGEQYYPHPNHQIQGQANAVYMQQHPQSLAARLFQATQSVDAQMNTPRLEENVAGLQSMQTLQRNLSQDGSKNSLYVPSQGIGADAIEWGGISEDDAWLHDSKDQARSASPIPSHIKKSGEYSRGKKASVNVSSPGALKNRNENAATMNVVDRKSGRLPTSKSNERNLENLEQYQDMVHILKNKLQQYRIRDGVYKNKISKLQQLNMRAKIEMMELEKRVKKLEGALQKV